MRLPHFGHVSTSPGAMWWQTAHVVNSGEIVSWADCVFSCVLRTRLFIAPGEGLCSPTKAWVIAPDSIREWNFDCILMRVTRSTGASGLRWMEFV